MARQGQQSKLGIVCLVCGGEITEDGFAFEVAGLGKVPERRAIHHLCARQLLLSLAGYETYKTVKVDFTGKND